MTEVKTIEALAAEVHGIYCVEYEKRFGKPYWTGADYSKLDEPTKDYDRAFVRWHLERIERLGKERAEQAEAQLSTAQQQVGALREREALFRQAVIDLEKSSEAIIAKCFQFREKEPELYGVIALHDELVGRLKTGALPTVDAPPQAAKPGEA